MPKIINILGMLLICPPKLPVGIYKSVMCDMSVASQYLF
jgi:hypothetical protein